MASRPNEQVPWAAAPERLPFPVNTTDANEFCPTPLPGNRLMFVSTRGNVCGGSGPNADIYQTRLHPVLGWLPPEHLGCNVNSGFEEFSPSLVEAEGVPTLFFSSSRSDPPRQKIYMSQLQQDGTWGVATLVNELNAAGGFGREAKRAQERFGNSIRFHSRRRATPGSRHSSKQNSRRASSQRIPHARSNCCESLGESSSAAWPHLRVSYLHQ